MAAAERVVDISEDAVAVRRRRRRALFRLGVPIFGIVLVILAIIGIALYSHDANRRGVLALSDDLLNTLDAQIAQRVAAFLDPCERAMRILRDIVVSTPPTERRANAERYALSVMKELPQAAAFYVGDSAGNFLMMRRDGAGVETKQIQNDEGARRVILVKRGADGTETSRREDPNDAYDPRTRPWYQGALATDDVFWTGIYIFFSDGKPGVTVSARLPDADGLQRVIGVDVTLADLSHFLQSLEIGERGRALLMDGTGRVIAVPDSETAIKPTGEAFVPPKVDELGDAVLTAAFDRFRVQGPGRRLVEEDGTRWITSTTRLPGSAKDWWILIVVPEQDFIGFVANNNQTALAMSLVIVVAVIALAVLLVRQGLRADRSVRLMTERGRSMLQQSAAYTAVSEQIAENADEAPPALTEALVTVTRAARASLWRLTANDQILQCPDSFGRDSHGHAGGFELHRRELPAFFDALAAGEEIAVADAAADPRTAQFHALIMRPLGSRSLGVFPLRRGARVIGAICLEDAAALDGARDFVRTLGTMVGATFKVTAEVEAPRSAALGAVHVEGASNPILSADLGPSLADEPNLRARHFPEIAVMVLRLTGPLALARKAGGGEAGLAEQIAELLQEIAADHGISYLKFVGQEAIAAAGLDDAGEDAMTHLAASAIAIRDRLSQLADGAKGGIEFRIGLGFGSGFGCVLGRERNQFNLWGEAVETAEIMARSAASGAIQASAGAYLRLRQDFLFRPRGSFYLPGLGQSRTFVLAGQI